LCDLVFELAHFLAGEFRHLSAWGSARISHPQNCGEFLKSETRSEGIANEEDSVERLRWV
jgi:hypothetical protein